MEVELRIYTPRWGHENFYRVTFERDKLSINMHPRHAEANYRENLAPEWSGESLERIFSNDMIYAPSIFQSCLEWAWLQWRNGEVADEAVAGELEQLAEWLNTITRSRPRSEFWNKFL